MFISGFTPPQVAASVWVAASRTLTNFGAWFVTQNAAPNIPAGGILDLRFGANKYGWISFAQLVAGMNIIMYDGVNQDVMVAGAANGNTIGLTGGTQGLAVKNTTAGPLPQRYHYVQITA